MIYSFSAALVLQDPPQAQAKLFAFAFSKASFPSR